jgi:hypothetical protein
VSKKASIRTRVLTALPLPSSTQVTSVPTSSTMRFERSRRISASARVG